MVPRACQVGAAECVIVQRICHRVTVQRKCHPVHRRVTLTVREKKRLKLITEVDAGRIAGREAAEMAGLPLRQVRRLIAAYRKQAAAGLAHGRGGTPHNKTPRDVGRRILKVAKETSHDYNDTHFTEKLEQKHGIKTSRSSLRRLRHSIGQDSPRKRRPPRQRPLAIPSTHVDQPPHSRWRHQRRDERRPSPALFLLNHQQAANPRPRGAKDCQPAPSIRSPGAAHPSRSRIGTTAAPCTRIAGHAPGSLPALWLPATA